MRNFFKYLTSGQEDKSWGLYLTVTGKYTAQPNSIYPSKKHPSGYYFDWDTGRLLDEYQLNFITEGHGLLQTNERDYTITPGTMMVISPGLKHRYRPNPESGWTEFYVGFNGKLADHFHKHTFGEFREPVIEFGNQLEILDTYQKIFDLVHNQHPAYQQVASGMILKLMGFIKSHFKKKHFEGKEIDPLIDSAKTYMWENVSKNADFHQFSRQHSVSYSYFRKMFKIYTGISPHQFYLDLKMMRAKELIVATDLPIKEITYALGFDSIHYFSKLFKKKTGYSPRELRQ